MLNQNSLDRHRNQIEKRISQLESKLQKRGNHIQSIQPMINDKIRSRDTKQHVRDFKQNLRDVKENVQPRHYKEQNMIPYSKTTQMRQPAQIRQPAQMRQPAPLRQTSQFRSPTQFRSNNIPNEMLRVQDKQNIQKWNDPMQASLTYNIRNNRVANQPQLFQNKDFDLLEMMKTILQGQKHIQKELNQIKNDYLRESTRRKQQDSTHYRQSESFGKKPVDPFQQIPTTNEGALKNASFIHQIHNKSKEKIKQAQTVKPTHKQRSSTVNRPRTGIVRRNLQADKFQQLINIVKNQRSKKQRVVITDDLKNMVWRQVQERIRDSDKEYKEVVHRNTKHQHDHLINTYELQKKLKDQLTGKIFLQCNNVFYK